MKILLTTLLFLTFNLYASSFKNIENTKESVLALTIKTIADTTNYGSAVVIDNGKLITSYHVIEDAKKVTTLINNKSYDVHIDKVSVKEDLAYLDINNSTLTPVKLNKNYKWNDKIYTLTGDGLVLYGVISKVEDNGIYVSYELPKGNSGGGVFNENNELIAIVSKVVLNQGITFAPTVDRFKNIKDIFEYQEAINLKTDNYDYSYCETNETITVWNKMIKHADLKMHSLHALFLGLCEKVKRKEITTEEANYLFLKDRKRLFDF